MDNSQIIEEIDIIVRAKIEEARKDIKNVAKETKKMVNSISSDMKKLNNDGKLDKFKEELKEFKEEMRKVKVNDGNWNINYTLGADTSEFDKAIEEAQKRYEEQMAETQKLQASIPSSSMSNQDVIPQVTPLQENLINFDYLPIKDELKTIGMQITELIPQIKTFGQEVQKVFTEQGRLIPEVAQKIKEFGVGISYIKGQVSQVFNPLKDKISEIKEKISPVTSVFFNMGKVAKNSVIQASANFKELANSTNNPIGKINALIKKIRNAGTETDGVKKKGKGFGNDFGKGIEKGISSIKKFALSLLSVRSAFSMVSKAAQAYLSFDTQLNDSLQNSWNTLGSLLAPILEYVVGLFSKLTSAVAIFVKTLTGVDLVAKANAKSLDKQSKSAKQASQSLSGIDDIDTLSTGSGGGDFASQSITVEDVDISPLMIFADRVKEIFSTLFQPFREAWENVGTGVFDSMVGMITSLGGLFSSIFSSFAEVWTNGTVTETIQLILLGFQQIFDIVGSISDTLKNAWDNNDAGTKTIQALWDGFNNLLQIAVSFFSTFKEEWDKVGQPICDTFMSIIQDLAEHFKNLTEKFKQIWEDGGKYLFEKIIEFGAKCIEVAGWIYNQFISPMIGWFIDKMVPAINPLLKAVGNIIDIATNVIDFFKNVFTGDWQSAWNNIKNVISGVWTFIKNLFSAGGKIFDGLVDGISGAFKTIVNTLIKGINTIIAIPFNKINGLLNDIRNTGIAGVKPFKGLWSKDPLPVPKIPQLASGDVAYEPIVAQIGEYAGARNNPEIVSPVSMMKDSFREVLNEFDFEGTRVERIVVNVAGENFYDDTIDYINEKSARKGVSVIKEV